MSPLHFKQLPRAVHRWLSFQRLCGRSTLFSEAYLTQPIGEFINFHHPGSIAPERDHPQFKGKKVGRPKQVDFALLTPHTNNVESVIESKWVSDSAYSKQAILDDLLRLECYRDPNCYVRRYFMMAGLRTNFESNFLNLKYSDGAHLPFTPLFLSSNPGQPEVTFNIFGTTGNLRKFYRRFAETYGIEIPKRVTTSLIARTRIDGICVYLWQVSSSKNRKTFQAGLPTW